MVHGNGSTRSVDKLLSVLDTAPDTRGGLMATAAEMVAEAKKRVQNLTVEETAHELESGDVLLVDIREPSERNQAGAIPAAIEAPRGMLEFWADPTSPYHRDEFQPDRRVILHCASGGRSALAAAMLQDLGYENVAHMDGGFNAWKEQGRPVQGGS
jgi:rhodanese-related sulfurtransferase